MYLTANRTRKAIAIFTLAMGVVATPLVGDSVSECYDKVLGRCADAMEGANFLERISVGLLCSGMLAGCGFEAL